MDQNGDKEEFFIMDGIQYLESVHQQKEDIVDSNKLKKNNRDLASGLNNVTSTHQSSLKSINNDELFCSTGIFMENVKADTSQAPLTPTNLTSILRAQRFLNEVPKDGGLEKEEEEEEENEIISAPKGPLENTFLKKKEEILQSSVSNQNHWNGNKPLNTPKYSFLEKIHQNSSALRGIRKTDVLKLTEGCDLVKENSLTVIESQIGEKKDFGRSNLNSLKEVKCDKKSSEKETVSELVPKSNYAKSAPVVLEKEVVSELELKSNNAKSAPVVLEEDVLLSKLAPNSNNAEFKTRRGEKGGDVCLVVDDVSKSKKIVEHTVEDSDSDVCIVKEDIQNPGVISERKRKLRLLQKVRAMRVLKCSECNFKTKSMQQLRVHEEAHPKGRKMKCSKCEFETAIKSCMIYHAAIHAGAKKFKCSKCNFKTDSINRFLAHDSQKFSCRKCSFTCHLKRDFEKHSLNVHKKVYPHDISFSSPVKKKRGRKRKERGNESESTLKEISLPSVTPRGSEKKLYSCDTCDYSTDLLNILQRHKYLHGDCSDWEENYFKRRKKRGRKPKDKRGKSETRKVDFEMPVITKDGEYRCSKCDFVTDDKLYFARHFKTHSRKEVELERKDIFKCSFCEFETEYERMMQNHLSTHTDSDSDFDVHAHEPMNQNLIFSEDKKRKKTVGNKLSSEVRSYKCTDCDFCTNFKSRLHKHISLHVRKNVFDTIFSSFL